MASWPRRSPFVYLYCVVLMHVLWSFVCAPAPGPFRCPSGYEISPEWVCDGQEDCTDGSDERDCGNTLTCSSVQFACADGQKCISAQHRCDSELDCDDHSDERGCPRRNCTDREFSCHNGRCVHDSYACDGHEDCGDGSDEQYCSHVRECPYRCNVTGMCIPNSWVCDHTVDCLHATDEIDCDGVNECPYGMFNCSKGGCVKASLVCDGTPDCPEPDDESDEDCPKRDCDSAKEFECDHSEGNGKTECLPNHWRCDGEVDCFDGVGSDEVSCIGSCGEMEFSCVTGGQCVPISVQCDGTEDCDDGTDEYLCDEPRQPIYCSEGTFSCLDGEKCVPGESICGGGTAHCVDQSDQDPMWCNGSVAGENECEGDSHGCEHHCNDTPFSYYCSCDPGYYVTSNRKNCSDINECELRDTCSQLCCNSPGSYECHCVDGYEEVADGRCKPIDEITVQLENHRHFSHRKCGEKPRPKPRMYYMLPSYGTEGRIQVDGATKWPYTWRFVLEDDPSIPGRQGYLLLMDKVDIRSIQPNGRRPRKLVRELAQTFAIDYHMRHQLMFWSELTFKGRVIKKAFLNGSNIAAVIDTGLRDPHGLAIDWITDKIYWTDALRSHVTVADLSGTNRTVLLSDDMKKPRGIALDPTTGYMYWTDWGSSPRIERASMDGKNRIVLHSTNIVWPNALTIDYATQYLYWIDAKLDFIETSFMDGTRRDALHRETNRHFRPFGLTLFKDHLYMADIDAREIRSFDIRNGSVLEVVYSEFVEPMAVVAVHPLRQPLVRLLCIPKESDHSCDCPDNITEPVVNPCDIDNGGCQYMCLLSSVEDSGYSCVCPTGHRLHPNGRDCLDLETFIILTDNSEVYIVSLDVPHPVNARIPLVGTDVVTAVTWDSRTDTLYFADSGLHTISSAKVTGEDQRVVIDGATVGVPMGLALDWLHDRLYWTDPDRDTIESSDLDGGRMAIVVYSGLDKPRDIVVDPERGLMFWSDWGKRPRIMRSALDGTAKTAIVSERIDSPNGIAVDYEKQVVYWVDGTGDTLEMVNYDGSNRLTLVEFELDVHPYGVGVYDEWVFWTDWREHNLQKVNVSSIVDTQELIGGLIQPRDANVFHRHRNRNATTPCSVRNGRCSHVCVTKATRNLKNVKAACMCPIGYPLLSDGRTCASVINATLLFPTGDVIHQISQDIDLYTADSVTPVSSPSETITSVALDSFTNIIYYADTASSGVHRLNISAKSEDYILDEHPTSIVSLAVDSSSQNLYYVDSYEKRVEVSRTDGSNRRVLHNGLVNPTGLAMDPVSLSLFYIDTGDTDRFEYPKIYSSAMDGTARIVVVSNDLVRPLYIAVDNNGVNGQIFWTDSYYNSIMSATFEGRNARAVVTYGPSDGASVVHGIAFFKGHIYFTDPGRKAILKSNLNGDKSVYLEGYDYVSDLKIVRPREGNVRGCSNASRCEYLCLPNPNVPSKQTCSCPTGIEMAADGSCPKVPSTFLLVAAQYSLRQIALDNANGEYVDITLYDSRDGFEINAVDYFLTAPGEGYIYFTEMKEGGSASIWSSRLVRQSLASTGDYKILLTEAGIIEDIAVDWTTGNIYYTANTMDEHSFIAMVDMDGRNSVTLINSGIGRPRGIALHPLENLMFWTDYGDSPKVERARMDGTERTSIVNQAGLFRNLRYLNDVVIDLNTEMLYFADGNAGIVGVVSLSGSAGRVIVNRMDDNPQLRQSQPVTSYIRQPRSLSIRHLSETNQDSDRNTEEAQLFWSDPEFHTISATDLVTTGRQTSGVRKSNLRTVLPRKTDYKPFAVQFVSTSGHRVGEITGRSTTPCFDSDCDFSCVNMNSTHYKCLCPDSSLRCLPRISTHRKPTDPGTSTNTPPSSTDPTDTIPPPNSSASSPTSDNVSRSTTSSTGSTVSEQSNERDGTPVEDVGIGLGTVVVLVLIVFAVFAVIIVFLVRRSRLKYERDMHYASYRGGVRTPLRSLSSPTSPGTPLKSNSFYLPPKQSNVHRNNSPTPRKNVPLQRALNPSQSVNEFVDEPAVYELGPVYPRRSRRLPTPDSLLKEEIPKPSVCDLESAAPSSNANATFECSEEISEGVVGPPPGEKPARSCLSSVSDSSQKVKPERTVSFVEVSIESNTDTSPPPPLPPKYEVSSDGMTCSSDSRGEKETSPVSPPPRPPKPLPLTSKDDKKDMSEAEGEGEKAQVLNTDHVMTGEGQESTSEENDNENCTESEMSPTEIEVIGGEVEIEGSGDMCVYQRLDSDGQCSVTSSGDSGSFDEARLILNAQDAGKKSTY